MMFNKFTALALLAVTLLAASACGRPSSDGSGDVTAANHGGSRMGVVHGWLKGLHKKVHENHRDCGFSGGVLGWAKGKLGFGPNTTGGSTTTETAAAPLPTNAYEVVEVTDDEDRVQPATGTAEGQQDNDNVGGSGVNDVGSGVNDADDRDNADETTASGATVVEAGRSEDASSSPPKTDGDESVATAVTVASGERDTSAENALTEDIDPRMPAQN